MNRLLTLTIVTVLAWSVLGKAPICTATDEAPRAGTIRTVAGNGVAGFQGDEGPAIDAQLNYPQGVAVDLLGRLLIADSGNGRIRQVSREGKITTVAGNGSVPPTRFEGDPLGDNGPAIAAPLLGPVRIAPDLSRNIFIKNALLVCRQGNPRLQPWGGTAPSRRRKAFLVR